MRTTKEVRIPLRPYLRWLKLERAASAIADGAMLSEAAYAAGFADAAHHDSHLQGHAGGHAIRVALSQPVRSSQVIVAPV
jgi:methylphosphotriester-DNA--protein-cysteine methyltransferase